MDDGNANTLCQEPGERAWASPPAGIPAAEKR
jgi:hypothetical protein